jgi:gluconolactonase
LHPSFAKYRLNNAGVEQLATGMRWAEGPVWFGDGRYLLWSDAALDRISRWDEETGQLSVFRKPANKPNGLTRDRQGRLLTCEHAGRRVSRTEYDGTITTLIDKFEGAEMDAKAQELVLLAALSLFCAGFAWILGQLVLGLVLFALGVVAVGAAWAR